MIQSSAAAHQLDLRPSTDVSYRVPWSVDRAEFPRFRFTNESEEDLRGVTLSLMGAAVMASDAPRVILAGESFRVTIHGRDIARDTILVIRWFRDGDGEYLWRVSF